MHKGVGRKWYKMAVEEIQESTEQDFRAYGRPFNSVPLFKYLVQIIKETNTEMEMEMDMEIALMGPLALYHCKRVVVLIQTDFREGRLA